MGTKKPTKFAGFAIKEKLIFQFESFSYSSIQLIAIDFFRSEVRLTTEVVQEEVLEEICKDMSRFETLVLTKRSYL